MAQPCVEGSKLPDWEPAPLPEKDDFDGDSLGLPYYAPRIDPKSFCDLTARPGWLRMRGQESGSSLNRVSLLARKLLSVNAEIVTKLDFSPELYQHSAGLILYYDNMNYAFLRKYYSETLGSPAISVMRVNNGEKTEYTDARRAVADGPLWLRLHVKGRESRFSWSADGEQWEEIGPAFDTSEFSDEYSQYGEFTGCFVGLTCADRVQHKKYADFDFFSYRDLEPELLPGAPTDNRA
jgi:xylan 1,4-beta-xylosidase